MVVTRFPPSPTGDLHIGSVRTALYSWLYARRHGGKMILRIEDTDQERSTDASVEIIVEGLQWLGLNWDEGPYYQTKRFDRYREVVQHLIDIGHAYRCICTKERLEAVRAHQLAHQEKPKYDGCCRDKKISADSTEPFCVRLKTPLTGHIILEDAVKGPIVFENAELDDLVIERSDRSPTYQLGVVVDDWDMKVTHVIRGDDHVNNTPRQMHILKALGAPLPVYAHIPMILGADGKRLSKRHGATSVLQYRDEGYLPHALLNYLVRLGWSHGDQEIFSLEEMIESFDLEHIQSSPACFNCEKLQWLNNHYLKTLPFEQWLPDWQAYLKGQGLDIAPAYLEQIASLLKERCKTLKELTDMAEYFWTEALHYDEKSVSKLFSIENKLVLEATQSALEVLPSWTEASIQEALHQLTESLSVGFGKIAQPLRFALTGTTVSPSMGATMAVLGRERSLKRLSDALKYV
jgi:glutamyl-tRNA synthetase